MQIEAAVQEKNPLSPGDLFYRKIKKKPFQIPIQCQPWWSWHNTSFLSCFSECNLMTAIVKSLFSDALNSHSHLARNITWHFIKKNIIIIFLILADKWQKSQQKEVWRTSLEADHLLKIFLPKSSGSALVVEPELYKEVTEQNQTSLLSTTCLAGPLSMCIRADIQTVMSLVMVSKQKEKKKSKNPHEPITLTRNRLHFHCQKAARKQLK